MDFYVGTGAGYGYGYGGYSYLLYILPALIFTLWAQWRVKSTFSKYEKVASDRGMTGADAARLVLQMNGVTDVAVARTAGKLTDHFDPRENVISLSENVYDARTAAAVGVAAHEAGHAVQYAKSYMPIHIRSAVIPATRIGSIAAWPLFVLGLLMAWEPLQLAGILLYGACVLFQLLTLPVELNASRRAVATLREAGLTEEATAAAKKVLTAAALTYVAALATALLQMLRLLAMFSGGRRRR